MTAAVDGVIGGSLLKSERYEKLRSRALDDRRAPSVPTEVSAVVLVRQGMSAWMQMRETGRAALRAGGGETLHVPDVLPAPEHKELLSVLTGMVFNIRRAKESA